MTVKYTNNAASKLSAPITSTATSFSVTTGEGSKFPALGASEWFYATLIDSLGNIEIVKVTGRATDTFTIVRAQDGTANRAWASLDAVELRITKAMLDDLKTDVAAGSLSNTAGGSLVGTNGNITFSSTGDQIVFTRNGYNYITANGASAVLQIQASGASGQIVLATAGTIRMSISADGTINTNGNIINSTVAFGTVMNMGGQADALGYNVSSGRGVYIKGTGNTYLYGGGTFYDGSAAQTLLHAGNYSSYAAPAVHTHSYLPLSGGTMTGSINTSSYDSPNALTASTDTNWAFGSANPATGQYYMQVKYYGTGSSTRGFRVYDAGSASTVFLANDLGATILGNVALHAGNYTNYLTSVSGPNSTVKQFFWDGLSASGSQARTFEIARLGIDYNDWNGGSGPFEVELYEGYYSRGLKKKYVISWGYVNSYQIQLVEYSGSGDNNFQCRVGTPVQVSGDLYYLPVYVDVRYYCQVDVRVTTNRDITTSNPPGVAGTYINASPTAVNISDFTADSTVNFSSVTGVQVAGNQLLHAGNYSSYALPLSGGSLTTGASSNIFIGRNSTATNYNAISLNGNSADSSNMGLTGGGVNDSTLYMNSPGNINVRTNSFGQSFWFYTTGIFSAPSKIISGNNTGFANDVYYAGARNPIWSFNNASSYGISYYQGSAGIGGVDAIGFSVNGTTSVTSNNFAISASASYVNNNVVLHAGNYTNYTLPIGGSWYGTGLPGSRYLGIAYNGGEFVLGNGLPNANQMGVLIDGCYVAGENNGFWSMGADNTWGSRRGMYWDGAYLRFDLGSPPVAIYGLTVGNNPSYDNPGGWNANLIASGVYHGRVRVKASSYNSSGDQETYMWVDNTVNPATGIYSTKGTFNFNGSISTVQVAYNTVLHAGNYSSYALPLSGGTGTGNWYTSGNVGTNRLTLRDDSIEQRADASDSVGVAVNYYGYNGGSTYFRNFTVYDGKGNEKFKVTGSSGAVTVAGNQVLHAGNYSSYAAPASHTHSYLPLGGGTMSSTLGSSMNDLGRLFASYNSSASGPLQFYIDHSYGSVNIGNARGTINFVTTGGLFSGGNTILHAGNYGSYALQSGLNRRRGSSYGQGAYGLGRNAGRDSNTNCADFDYGNCNTYLYEDNSSVSGGYFDMWYAQRACYNCNCNCDCCC